MDTSDAITVQFKGDKQFEILVDPDLAKEAKMEGKTMIYSDCCLSKKYL